ncbi:hypothetical protein PS1_001714 [Malus domestica]
MIVASPRRIAKPSRPSFSSCMGPTSHHTCRPLLYSSQSLQTFLNTLGPFGSAQLAPPNSAQHLRIKKPFGGLSLS